MPTPAHKLTLPKVDALLSTYGEDKLRPLLDTLLRHNTTTTALGALGGGVGGLLWSRRKQREDETDEEYKKRNTRLRMLRNSLLGTAAGTYAGFRASHSFPNLSKSLNEAVVNPVRQEVGRLISNNVNTSGYHLDTDLKWINMEREEDGTLAWLGRTLLLDQPRRTMPVGDDTFNSRNEVPWRKVWGLQPREDVHNFYEEVSPGNYRIKDPSFIKSMQYISTLVPEESDRVILNTDSGRYIGEHFPDIDTDDFREKYKQLSELIPSLWRTQRPDLRNFTLYRTEPTEDNPSGFRYMDRWDSDLHAHEKMDSLANLGRHLMSKIQKPFNIDGPVGPSRPIEIPEQNQGL